MKAGFLVPGKKIPFEEAEKLNIESLGPGTIEIRSLSLTEQASRLLQRIESELSDTCGLADQPLTEVELFRKLAVLDSLKKINGEIEKSISVIRAPLEEQALSRFETLGINNFNIDGRTVYLHREWWAKTKEGHLISEAIDALKRCDDTAPFVKETFNTQSVSAYFRERRLAMEEAEEQGTEYPLYPTSELEATLDFSEKISVRSRAGGK